MKREIVLISLSVILVLILGLIFYFSSYKLPKTPSSKLGPNEALLILKFGSSQRWFKGQVIDGMTASDALMASASGANLKIKMNSTLEAVDKFQNNGQKRWRCYLNNKDITNKLEQAEIHPRDKILCEYR